MGIVGILGFLLTKAYLSGINLPYDYFYQMPEYVHFQGKK